MTTITKVKIDPLIKEALEQAKKRIKEKFEVDSLILFGSVSRGDFGDESDVDILIISKRILSREERHKITYIVFEINLEFGSNLSAIVVDKDSWENGLFSFLPIKMEVERDGIII